MDAQYLLEACQYHFLLEAGLITVPEIVSWADDYIANVGYNDAVADLAIGSGSMKDLLAGLREIGVVVDQWDALRKSAPRLADILESAPDSLEKISRLLERAWISSGYSEPEDFGFVIACYDDYLLIREGVYGSISCFREGLIKSLRNLRH